MHLVNKKNDIAVGLDFVNKILDSAFKLTAELSSGNKSGKIKQVYFLVCKPCGNFAAGNFQRKTLRDCCFTNAGFTDKAGIVL